MLTGNSISAPVKKENALILVDEKLRLDPKQPVDMYCCVSETEISAALFSPRKNQFLALASAAKPASGFDTFIKESGLPALGDIHRTRIMLAGGEYTLIPAGFFREDDAAYILAGNFSGENAAGIFSQPMPCIDGRLVARQPSWWSSAVNSFPAATLSHALPALAEALFLQYKNKEGAVVLLHTREGFADILVKRGRTLLLANTFACDAPADFLYHTLNVCEQLQLNPEQDLLVLAGDVRKEGALFGLLSAYFQQPEFASRPSVAGYSFVFDSLPQQAYYSLFSQVLCES